MKQFLAGVIATLAGLALLGSIVVWGGFVPINADETPSGLEPWLAGKARHATIHRLAPQEPNPMEANVENLKAGVGLYKDNCIFCHGKGDTSYYPPIPKFDRSFKSPDGNLFYIVKHGIRMTGMPSFGKSLKDDDIWKIVLFLKNLDKLPPEARAEMDK